MSKKGKLGLLLISVVVVAVILSSCALLFPPTKVAPTLSVSPTSITAYSGQPFSLTVNAQSSSGISQIVATFMGSSVVKTTSPATFAFDAPTVVQGTQYPLTVTAKSGGSNPTSVSTTVDVTVWPTVSGTITYAVQLNNIYPHVYLYPIGPAENGSVMFTINVFKGQSLLKGVNVYVDGSPIPATPTNAPVTLSGATVQSTQLTIEKSYMANYYITANHVGPHTYYVVFYGTNGATVETSQPGNFYITWPAAQKVTLSAATPVYNTQYVNGVSGNVSFTAKATDYTSQYEGFMINGTPFATYVNVATAVKVVGATYPITVPASVLTSAGTTVFTFKDTSIGGNAVSAIQTYVVVKSAPVLRASYKGIPSSGNTLYVGISPTTFQVYAADPFWFTSAATLGVQPFSLTKDGTATVDVSGLTNNATEAFTAKVVNGANLSTALNLTIVRVTVNPNIIYANVSGLATYNGVPYSTSGNITVSASVTSPYLSSVTWVLSGNGTPSQYTLTKSSTGLWVGSVNTANLLPGTYKSWISAQDLALNVATALTSPATVNVYRSVQNVFTTSLTTVPSTPVNGYVRSATLTANINPTWIYAINKVVLYHGTSSSTPLTGTPGAVSYPFTLSASGTYFIVTIDNVNQRATGTSYTVDIDNSLPQLALSPATQTAKASSVTIVGSATDTYSGISNLTLSYQTLGATGADNGGWVTIGSTNTGNATSVSSTFTWKNLNTLPDGKYNIELVGTSGVGLTSTATGYVINDNAGAPIVSAIFPAMWTNSTSTTVNIGATVKNESDVTITATSGNSALINFATSTYTSKSYTAYPLTKTWSAAFTGENGTSVAKVVVTDLTENTVTATKLIGFDNVSPTATVTAPATVAGVGTFTVTVDATDNLSAIKSVTVGGVPAVLSGTPTATNEFGVLDGTYVATLTINQTTSGSTSYNVVVVDNAGNTTTKTFSVYVDANAPSIAVGLVNTHGYQTISNGASEVNYTSMPASFTWSITTRSGTSATVTGTIMKLGSGSSEIFLSSPSTTYYISSTTGSVTIEASGQYVITIVATNPINGLVETFHATKTVVIDNTPPTVKLTLPATLNLANYSTAVATYTATDVNFKAATLTINGVSISVSQTNSGTELLSQFGLNGLSYRSMTATLTAIDKALNTSATSATFTVDTVSPKINMTGTIYKTGGEYAVDVNFADTMKPATLVATDFQFYKGTVLWYNIAATTGVSYDPSTGFLHIYNLVTPAGSIVSVSALANYQFTVKASTAFESIGGNPLSPNSTLVTFSPPYGTSKPVNP